MLATRGFSPGGPGTSSRTADGPEGRPRCSPSLRERGLPPTVWACGARAMGHPASCPGEITQMDLLTG